MSKNKKNIAIITNGAFPVPAVRGGAVEALTEMMLLENERLKEANLSLISIYDDLAVEASRKYPSTDFHFLKPSKIWSRLDHGIHYVSYDLLHSKRHLAFKTIFQRLSYLYQAAELIHQKDFDAVVVENQMASLWVFKYKNNQEKYEGKYFFHLHNHPAKYANAEKLVCRSKKIICVSEFIGRAFAKNIGINYTNDLFSVLHNAVDEEIFDPSKVKEEDLAEIRNKLGIDGKRVILFVGRLIPGKGVSELMRAFKQMNEDDAVLLIVGSFNFNSTEKSPYEDELNQLIHEIGTDKVLFTGYISHNDVPKYYCLGDIVILPSTCEDAAPLAVIETIRMRRPLITTTMGGIPEYADPSCSILLENNENLVENIRKTAKELLADEAQRNRMSENAAKVSSKWNLKSFYHNFLEIING